MKIQTDSDGRRFVVRADGTRIYLPKPAITEAERDQVRRRAAEHAKHIERYHRQFPQEES